MSMFARTCSICVCCALGCSATDETAGTTGGDTTTEDGLDPGSSTTGEAASTGDFAPTGPTTGIASSGGDDAGSSSSSSGSADEAELPPDPPRLSLAYSPIKQFDFTWTPPAGAEYYQLLEKIDKDAPWTQLGEDLVGTSSSWTMPLHLRARARYGLRACNSSGCGEPAPVAVGDGLNAAIGYIKASNAESSDNFGDSVAVSGDGNTIVVGAYAEDSGAIGVNGDQLNNASPASGAAYVFVRTGSTWTQEAYLKASNADSEDWFGRAVAISGDGDTIAVGATGEDSAATGVYGDAADDSLTSAGAVYVYTRKAGVWGQVAYVKASNAGVTGFGEAVALSADGKTLAVGAPHEDTNAKGVSGFPLGGTAPDSGAVYLYGREGDIWSHRVYIKASNTDPGDQFGKSVALSGDGKTLAVGAPEERSAAAGVDGDQADNSRNGAGAVYVFRFTNGAWVQQAYVKASNPDHSDSFGYSVALSFDGDALATGAYGEDSTSTAINGNQLTEDAYDSGAVYVFSRIDGKWSQEAYVKAPNAVAEERFGFTVALSGDGNLLAAGAPWEGGGGAGVATVAAYKNKPESGAAYVFVRRGEGWSYESYVKASNPDIWDWFGRSLGVSADGSTLVVGAIGERSLATGIGGLQSDDSGGPVGAVYVY